MICYSRDLIEIANNECFDESSYILLVSQPGIAVSNYQRDDTLFAKTKGVKQLRTWM